MHNAMTVYGEHNLDLQCAVFVRAINCAQAFIEGYNTMSAPTAAAAFRTALTLKLQIMHEEHWELHHPM